MKLRAACLAVIVPLLLGLSPAFAHDKTPLDKVGTVRFPTSCAPAVQGQFERAVALLHSFWYEEAVKEFTAVTASDPSCAIGAWGVAMSVYYPLWQPPSKAMLEKGAAALAKAQPLSATPREKDYLAAIGADYRDHETVDHRTRAGRHEKARE